MSAEQDTALFDQPWDEDPAHVELDARSKRKRQARDPRGLSVPQTIMLRDIAQLGQVLDVELGPQDSDEQVRTLALEAINTQHLQLSLKQWAKVQQMVEAGVRLGIASVGERPGT